MIKIASMLKKPFLENEAEVEDFLGRLPTGGFRTPWPRTNASSSSNPFFSAPLKTPPHGSLYRRR